MVNLKTSQESPEPPQRRRRRLAMNQIHDSWFMEKFAFGQAPVAHACNPSYSGGRDQEDCSSKLAWANSSARPYLEKSFTKIGLVEWLKVKALSSSPSTAKQKQKQQKK
jgi:hypothetical protein